MIDREEIRNIGIKFGVELKSLDEFVDSVESFADDFGHERYYEGHDDGTGEQMYW